MCALKKGIKDPLLGQRLREERVRLRLGTQAEAAKLCDVSREMWGQYERGQVAPGGEVLKKLSALGVDTQYVLSGEGQPATSEAASSFQGFSWVEHRLLSKHLSWEEIRELERELRQTIRENADLKIEQMANALEIKNLLQEHQQLLTRISELKAEIAELKKLRKREDLKATQTFSGSVTNVAGRDVHNNPKRTKK